MLPLLDVETYNAIAQDNSDAGCSGIRRAKASFEDKNLALGVYYMLEEFQFCMPLLHRDTDLEKGHVDFKVSRFWFYQGRKANDCLGNPLQKPPDTTNYRSRYRRHVCIRSEDWILQDSRFPCSRPLCRRFGFAAANDCVDLESR